MLTTPWSFVQNPFLNASRKNFKKYLSMSYYHYNRLLKVKDSDPFALLLFKYYEPVHLAFVAAYNKWHAAQGTQTSTTGALQNKLHELESVQAKQWDKAVQNIYDEDTDEYKAIFPHHRQPFMTGGQDARISAVGTLIEQMKNYPLVETIRKNQVEPFYAALQTADATKDGNIGGTGTLSDAVEAARVAAGWTMYGNLGLSMNEYKDDSAKIEMLFPVKQTRDHEQLDFLGHVAMDATVSIVHRTLKPAEMITLGNGGKGPLKYFAATAKDQKTSDKLFTVEPGKTLEISAEQFGNSKSAPFINVWNDNSLLEGEFEISLG